MSDKTIGAELIAALEIALLEREPGGRLRVLGTPPAWFVRLCPRESVSFPFLDNFLIDAESFWTDAGGGRLRSGIWTEADPLGHETNLEASAVCVGPRKILLIENQTLVHDEKQATLQKARTAKLRERERRRTEKGRPP
ncbi:MAG TPA: hypothetical protein VFW15_09470 [Thermoanaerobaculia bacterium]|nr:hypothetical protein [Thermoanaerobaculia bacterium]